MEIEKIKIKWRYIWGSIYCEHISIYLVATIIYISYVVKCSQNVRIDKCLLLFDNYTDFLDIWMYKAEYMHIKKLINKEINQRNKII